MLLYAFAQRTEYPTPSVREEQKIVVDGVTETWRLQWTAVPEPTCEAGDSGWQTCPCMGFAYGEAGDLFLVRLRDGVEIDRLHLTPFFTDGSGKAQVQRWQADFDNDAKDYKQDEFPALVAKRPTVQVMHFGDYNHDLRANEFYLQTESVACGKNAGIVIGLTKGVPRLHAFSAASNRENPLVLYKREWEAVRTAKGAVDILDWACGDHGSDTETRLRLHWTPEGLDGVRRQYTCPADGAPRRLIHEERLR
jgi:hypothetical protein